MWEISVGNKVDERRQGDADKEDKHGHVKWREDKRGGRNEQWRQNVM